jgi:hypothetical protein
MITCIPASSHGPDHPRINLDHARPKTAAGFVDPVPEEPLLLKVVVGRVTFYRASLKTGDVSA